jgi:hypothetical protein
VGVRKKKKKKGVKKKKSVCEKVEEKVGVKGKGEKERREREGKKSKVCMEWRKRG